MILRGMEYRLLFIFAVMLLAFQWNASAQCYPIAPEYASENAFRPGEKLTYIIHYKWLGIRTDVGSAEVVLGIAGTVDGRRILHPVAKGKTYRFWDAFFKVDDLYESQFYEDTRKPLYFHRDIHEGKYFIENYYHWNDSTYGIAAKVIKKNEVIDTVLPGKECSFDILTLFYNARNFDFEALEYGTNNPVSFAIDEELFDIYFRYIGRETKRIPGLGHYRTMKFAAKVVAGEVFTGEQEMTIWVSDDSNRIPLMFEAPVLVGSVFGRLSGWENIKYPFESKVEQKRK